MRKIKHLRDVPLSCYWLERIFIVQMLRRKDEPEENGKKGVAIRAGRNMICSLSSFTDGPAVQSTVQSLSFAPFLFF